MTDEEWRPAPRWEGYYEVSTLGRVASVRREVPTRAGGRVTVPRTVLKHHITRKGHHIVSFWRDRKKKNAIVHRIICEAFHGPAPEGKPWALHRDDDKDNNTPGNLYWGTPSDNLRDSIRNGTHVNSNKTHCKQGHPFDSENTYFNPNRPGRTCRTCRDTPPQGEPPVHGTMTGYKRYRCRCDKCREVVTLQTRDYRERKRGKGNT